MTDNHPITPPPKLIRQWMERTKYDEHTWFYESYIAEQAARWGADHELNACCEWIYKLMDRGLEWSMDLRASRRPKPPSLKERALQAWAAVEAGTDDQTAMAVIRRALEALPE